MGGALGGVGQGVRVKGVGPRFLGRRTIGYLRVAITLDHFDSLTWGVGGGHHPTPPPTLPPLPPPPTLSLCHFE